MRHEADESPTGPRRPDKVVDPTVGRGVTSVPGRAALLVGLALGLVGCMGAGEVAISNAELMDSIRARAGDLQTRISYAERRADALKTRIRASRRLADEIRADLRSAGVNVSSGGAAFVVGIASKLLFPAGCTALADETKDELDKVAIALKTRLAERPIRVEGHTDTSKPWRTADDVATNWELSAARALAVARYLTESCGVSPERISVAAYGDTRPIAPNDTKEGRAQNRRVEIVLTPPIETIRVSARIE